MRGSHVQNVCGRHTEAAKHNQPECERSVRCSLEYNNTNNTQVLYPPLTFLRATGAKQTITVGDSTLTIMEVVPSM